MVVKVLFLITRSLPEKVLAVSSLLAIMAAGDGELYGIWGVGATVRLGEWSDSVLTSTRFKSVISVWMVGYFEMKELRRFSGLVRVMRELVNW